jgi:hypothetical protein
MFTRTLKIAAVGGALLLGLAVSASSHGWSNSLHCDYVTFSGAVALPGVTLPAGTYRFEVPDVAMSSGIVSVSSRDGRKVYLTQYTLSVDRPKGGESLSVMLGEAAPGTAPQVKAWFPIGERSGRQFIYN